MRNLKSRTQFFCFADHKINDHDLWLQRLDIRGKIKVLHGQNKKTEEAPLALFCLCTPFGPPSLLEIPHKEVMFKSKHKLDLGFVSMDHRGKEMLQYDDEEMSEIGGYDLVHHDDLAYVASAHQECNPKKSSKMKIEFLIQVIF